MDFKVEVLAIYADPGATVTNQKRNQRDSDYTDAQTRVAAVGHYIDPDTGQTDPAEYLEKIDPPSRYGFGWRAGQFLSVQQDGDDVGRAIASRIASRGMRPGSKVEVFEHRVDDDPFATGALIFSRYW